MIGVLIKARGKAEVINFEDNLDDLYRLTECDCIDIPTRQIGDKYYNFVCDDEGLLKENPTVTAYDTNDEPMLVGNLLICNDNDNGELTGLNAQDIFNILSHLITVGYINEDCSIAYRDVLTEVDY